MGKIYAFRNSIIFIFSVLTLLFSSCQETDTDHDGLTDELDKCPMEIGVKKNSGCPVIPQIRKIHLYLDNSASMAGYYNDLTEYKTVVSDLAVKLDKEIKPVDISFISNTALPYRKSLAEFTNDLAITPMAAQKSSELHRMIENVANHCGNNDIAVLVSDCILSFPDSNIKSNPEINRNNAESTLKNNIYATFVGLRKKGFAASIYGFKSKFYGIYYDYQNKKTKLPGIVRPYYVWVIAKKGLLLRFNEQLEHINSFQPENALHFGLVDEPVKTYTILPELERKGDWSKSSSGVSDVELPKGHSLQIGAVLNLASLPSYAKDIKYLKNNLRINARGCKAKFEINDKTTIISAKLRSESQILAFESASHVLLITVSDMSLSQADIHFNLPLKYDTWYQDWSTMDDRGIALQSNKTFAFEHLISGVREAYSTWNKNYIDFSLSLTK